MRPEAPEIADDASPASLHQNLIAIGRLRLELVTVAGEKCRMKIRHILFLCLLAVTLAVTGPFSRGLSAQAAVLLQTTDAVRSGDATNLKTGAAPFKRCQRGAVAWSSCALDLGHVPKGLELSMASASKAFERVLDGAAGDLLCSRLFRPPRSS